MDSLLTRQLAAIEEVSNRTKVALIKELLPGIADAQERGFSLGHIHSQINECIDINFNTFSVTLCRARDAVKNTKIEKHAHVSTVASSPPPSSLSGSVARVKSDSSLSRTEKSKLIFEQANKTSR